MKGMRASSVRIVKGCPSRYTAAILLSLSKGLENVEGSPQLSLTEGPRLEGTGVDRVPNKIGCDVEESFFARAMPTREAPPVMRVVMIPKVSLVTPQGWVTFILLPSPQGAFSMTANGQNVNTEVKVEGIL